MSAAVTESVKYVKRVGEHCDPKFFYHTYRFFLNGWGTDGDILPDGIEFEARLPSDTVEAIIIGVCLE